MMLPVRPPQTVSMLARDGVRLDADVYVPDAPGPFPVLLMRQPYSRRIASTVCYAHPDWYAAHGFIVAVQDVRGRGTSEGVFRTFETDAADGADAVAWAAALPGSSGAVGMYGFSYQGTIQLLAAGEASPLRALAPAMSGWDLRTDWAFEGGAFALQGGMGWAIQIAAESARRAGDVAAYRELRAASQTLPLGGEIAPRPDVLERHRALTHYHTWLDTPADSPYWRGISPASRSEKIIAAGVPTLLVGGWFDSHLPGTLAAHRALAEKIPLRLVIGPWAHFPWGRRVGALDFSADAISDIDRLQVQWFDRWLSGNADATVAKSAVRLFDMGTLCWRDFPTWPASGKTLFLDGGGRAALDERDGRLQATPPISCNHETFVHDPWRPAPSVGAALDRADVDARPDVLTFTTSPADAPLLLAGDVRAVLDVTADAEDFDVGCVLSRIGRTGQVIGFAQGYRRVSAPGPIEVPMRATCLTLQPGERLRLSIAAAAFPAFPVNPGTGVDPTRARTIDARVITLRVRHGSRVIVGG